MESWNPSYTLVLIIIRHEQQIILLKHKKV